MEIIFREAKHIGDPGAAYYSGFNPSTNILTKGASISKGGLPLPCDILWERDVAVKLRDGVTIYIDIFRPVDTTTKVPAIISWISGKSVPHKRQVAGVSPEALSGLQNFESADPAYWCNHGYAIINPDTRGAFMSDGDIYFWGKSDAHDSYDVIEWASSQDWCNGKVGMSGNSHLAIMQWFTAAEQPPHLAAIAPWEGITDLYRQDICRGGIPNSGFNEQAIAGMTGKNRVEDIPAMLRKYPLMNSYWQDEKTATLENINTPAYIVASWTNDIHVFGTFDGFRRISSKDKWLRVHNTHEWPDYYTPENVEDLRRFFDYYLKDIDNSWKSTPKIRLSVLDPGGKDTLNRVENEWPLARTEHQKLFLDASTGKLSTQPLPKESSTTYQADDGEGQVAFTITFDKETELTGYMKLRLWVEADGSNDMDLYVFVQKLDAQGNLLMAPTIPNVLPDFRGPSGRLRVSHRELDPKRSTPAEPYLTHTMEQLLSPGQIVPVEIGLWPVGMFWHAGQQLRVIVAGYNIVPFHIPGIPQPILRNKGKHIIHTGGKYDSYLQIPFIPSK